MFGNNSTIIQRVSGLVGAILLVSLTACGGSGDVVEFMTLLERANQLTAKEYNP